MTGGGGDEIVKPLVGERRSHEHDEARVGQTQRALERDGVRFAAKVSEMTGWHSTRAYIASSIGVPAILSWKTRSVATSTSRCGFGIS